jgi:hypothetical protein
VAVFSGLFPHPVRACLVQAFFLMPDLAPNQHLTILNKYFINEFHKNSLSDHLI